MVIPTWTKWLLKATCSLVHWMVAPQRHVHVLISRTCDHDFIWIKGLCWYSCSTSEDEIILSLGVLNPMTGVLIKERQEIWARDTEEKVMWRWRWKLEWCINKPMKAKDGRLGEATPRSQQWHGVDCPPEPPEGSKSVDTLVLDYWPPELWGNTFWLL